MPVPVQCRNPDCHASFQIAPGDAPRLLRCPHCDWELHAEEGPGRSSTLTPGPIQVGELEKDRPPPGAADPLVGEMLAGRYRIVEILGQGGMGTVYLAVDTRLGGRKVAVKVPTIVDLKDVAFLKRLEREAHIAAQFQHPNICPIYDVGTHHGRPFLVLAYIEGTSLAEHLRRRPGPFDVAEAVRLVSVVAGALQEAHQTGIIHRDLKPDNIMIARGGRPIVMDFGLAKRADSGEKLTSAGKAFGTPAYMPIEQYRDVAAIDHRADIYSLGVTLYQLLTGRLPYPGSLYQILAALQTTDPTPPSKLRREVDPDLESICLKAMAREAGERYDSMRAFAEALDLWLKRAGSPPPEPPPPATPRASGRGRRSATRGMLVRAATLFSIALGVFVSLVLLGWLLVFMALKDRQAPITAARTRTDGPVARPDPMPRPAEPPPTPAPGVATAATPAPSPSGRKSEPEAASTAASPSPNSTPRVRAPAPAPLVEPKAQAAPEEAARLAAIAKQRIVDDVRERIERVRELLKIDEIESALKTLRLAQLGVRAREPIDEATRKALDGEIEAEIRATLKAEERITRKRAEKLRLQAIVEDVNKRFKMGKYQEVDRDLRREVSENNPVDARVWYLAALSNGLATGLWTDRAVELVRKGIEREKAGTPTRAEIDAAFAGLSPAQGKDWLASYRKTAAAPAPPAPPPSWTSRSTGMTFALIPVGDFVMGSAEGEDDIEKPPHPVTISRPFYLGIHEVTQREYKEAMGNNPSYFSAGGGGKDLVVGQSTERHPVEYVNWDDAIAFCNTLSERDGLTPYYRPDAKEPPGGDGYRLPTEAEWEYACRARSTTRYSFGDEASLLKQYAWYGEDPSKGTTHPVGQKAPNAFGLYDMHGNLWEWCRKWQDKDRDNKFSDINSTDKNSGNVGVLRGGSWLDDAEQLRSSFRLGDDPAHRHINFGVRLARSYPQAP